MGTDIHFFKLRIIRSQRFVEAPNTVGHFHGKVSDYQMTPPPNPGPFVTLCIYRAHGT